MLIGERARLRAVERDDLPRFVAWLNDPEVRSHVLMFAPVSMADEERWLERLGTDASSRVFAIDGREGERWEHLGACGIHELDLRNGSCVLGIYLGDSASRGRGIGTEAMKLLLAFAFGELRLHRVALEVFEDNAAARRMYEKLGFVEEGRRRESVYKGGRWLSPVVMSLLEPDFRPRRGG